MTNTSAAAKTLTTVALALAGGLAIACGAPQDDGDGFAEEAATAAAGKFELFQGFTADGKPIADAWFFHVRAGNGEIMLRSQAYTTRENAKDGAVRIVNGTAPGNANTWTAVPEKAANGEFFFNLKNDGNHKIIGTSETYVDEGSRNNAIGTLTALVKATSASSVSDALASARQFETFESRKDGKFYFHLRAKNGEIVFRSQGYRTKDGAERGMLAVRRLGEVESNYEVLPAGRDGQAYFRLKSGQQIVPQIVGRGEVYETMSGARTGVQTMIRLLVEAQAVKGDDLNGPKKNNCTKVFGNNTTFNALFEDASWKHTKDITWNAPSEVKEAGAEALILAAIIENEGAKDAPTTLAGAFKLVDQNQINFFVFEKGQQKLTAIEFGRGDNSMGSVFGPDGKIALANQDGDLMIPTTAQSSICK